MEPAGRQSVVIRANLCNSCQSFQVSSPRSAHLPFPNFSVSAYQLLRFQFPLSAFPFALFSFSVCKYFILRGFARVRVVSRGPPSDYFPISAFCFLQAHPVRYVRNNTNRMMAMPLIISNFFQTMAQ
jgi:hypothetical protein